MTDYRYGLPNRNTILSQGGDEKLLQDLPEAISIFLELWIKLEANLAREVYFPNLKSEGFSLQKILLMAESEEKMLI
jgi:hypothetical protein